MKLHRILILSVIILSFFVDTCAYAYIDLGSGSYILQMILAAFFGAVFTFKVYYKKIRDYFRNRNKQKDNKI